MGAIASGGVRVLNDQVLRAIGIPEYVIDAVAQWEQKELERRERVYRGDRPPPEVHGRTVILVDDGLATGATMLAAVRALRKQQPARIVVAVPTASPDTCELLKSEADEVICAMTPEPFHAVGLWYDDFFQTNDEEYESCWRVPPRPNDPMSGWKEQGELWYDCNSYTFCRHAAATFAAADRRCR